MIKNARSLMDKVNNLAKKCDITTNEVLQNYMFERILERLSANSIEFNTMIEKIKLLKYL